MKNENASLALLAGSFGMLLCTSIFVLGEVAPWGIHIFGAQARGTGVCGFIFFTYFFINSYAKQLWQRNRTKLGVIIFEFLIGAAVVIYSDLKVETPDSHIMLTIFIISLVLLFTDKLTESGKQDIKKKGNSRHKN